MVYFVAFALVGASCIKYWTEHCRGIINAQTSIQTDIVVYAQWISGVLGSILVCFVGLHWHYKNFRSLLGLWSESNRFISNVIVLLKAVLNSEDVTEADIRLLAITAGEYKDCQGMPFNPVERFGRLVQSRLAKLAFTVKEHELFLHMGPSWVKQKMIEFPPLAMASAKKDLTELFDAAENLCLLGDLDYHVLFTQASLSVGDKYNVDMKAWGL